MIILINSKPKDRIGIVDLEKPYKKLQIVYGTVETVAEGTEVRFTLPADKSTVFRLK